MVIYTRGPDTAALLTPHRDMHFFQTYCWLLQTLINNVLHPPFHKMQRFSRIIRKQQRTFWFQTKTETKPKTSYSKELIVRKQNQPNVSHGGLIILLYIYLTKNHHSPCIPPPLTTKPATSHPRPPAFLLV